MQSVKCNCCEWQGKEDKLKIVNDVEYCPNCGKSHGLMDLAPLYVNGQIYTRDKTDKEILAQIPY
jgi:hypothetical protein